MKAQVALADTFWDSFAKLPKAQTKKVVQFVTKFRQSADSGGINYEKINAAAQDNYRSVRIDQAYRGIVLKPDTGKTFILLWVDHHDDAYAWAARTRCEIHPETGALQLYETAVTAAPDIVEAEPASVQEEQKDKPRLPDPLFNLDESRLLGIGVPQPMLESVADLRSESELEAIKNQLPVEAFEALYLFSDGISWDEIWSEYHIPSDGDVDTTDFDAALERDVTKRRFTVPENELELQEMLAAPLEKWRVFLHPSQRKLVERHWNGPVRVLGGAGTGKTVVAMHRAVWLIENVLDDGEEKVLFLTYNTNLAQDIRQNLAKIATTAQLSRIEVINIDAWVSRFLKARNYANSIVGEGQLHDLWDLALGAVRPSEPDLPDSFYKEEWERVVLPHRILGRDEYLKVSRTGRGVALSRRQRAALWPVFDEMRSQMQQQGLRTYQDASLDAAEIIQLADVSLPYRCVVVDEAQDMGPEALQLIRRLANEDKDDLFLVGDGHQRIYRKRAVMSQCGIKIVGRGRRLKINYRTTEQIRRFAAALLEGQTIDDLDGDEDPRAGYRSLTFGVLPKISGFDDVEAEANYIFDELTQLSDNGADLRSCCVMLRTQSLRDEYADLLRVKGMAVVTLANQADNQSVGGVRIATMHRVKGLEFRHVFLAAISDGIVPNRYAVTGTEDPVEQREKELSERALLHVASSRAIEDVYVTYHGEPSEYLVQQ